jgi:hypothetical protein
MHRERMPLKLKTTIRGYLSKTFLNQRYVPSYISELSGSLKREMYLTLFKDLIVKVPFFSDWSNTAITEIVEHFRLKVIFVPLLWRLVVLYPYHSPYFVHSLSFLLTFLFSRRVTLALSPTHVSNTEPTYPRHTSKPVSVSRALVSHIDAQRMSFHAIWEP